MNRTSRIPEFWMHTSGLWHLEPTIKFKESLGKSSWKRTPFRKCFQIYGAFEVLLWCFVPMSRGLARKAYQTTKYTASIPGVPPWFLWKRLWQLGSKHHCVSDRKLRHEDMIQHATYWATSTQCKLMQIGQNILTVWCCREAVRPGSTKISQALGSTRNSGRKLLHSWAPTSTITSNNTWCSQKESDAMRSVSLGYSWSFSNFRSC